MANHCCFFISSPNDGYISPNLQHMILLPEERKKKFSIICGGSRSASVLHRRACFSLAALAIVFFFSEHIIPDEQKLPPPRLRLKTSNIFTISLVPSAETLHSSAAALKLDMEMLAGRRSLLSADAARLGRRDRVLGENRHL